MKIQTGNQKSWVVGLLAMSLAAGMLSGCSDSGNTEQNNRMNQEDRQKQSDSKATKEEIADAAKIEIEELEEITEWETMAKVELGEKISIDGEGISEKNGVLTVSKGGEYIFFGTLENGSIVVDTKDDVKLTLDGVELSSENAPVIYGKNSNCIYISTEEGSKNLLSDDGEYEDAKGVIFSNDNLIFTGSGELKVTGSYKHGICSDDMIYIEGGNIEIASAVKDGLHANDGICVDGGKVEIENVHDAMESEGAFRITGGELTLTAEDDGLAALGNMEITGGNIRILSCEEGLEAKNVLSVQDGEIEISANDDGMNGGSELQIAGGRIYTNISRGDGLDSNGSLTISGGLVVAMGAEMPEGGIDCDQREVVITGGTLIACGGTNSAPSESESSQVSVLLGASDENEKIGILDEDGNTVFAFVPEKSYSNLFLSVKSLEKDRSYTVYTGGTIQGENDFHGYYQEGVYSGGEQSVEFTADSTVISAGGIRDGGRRGGKNLP